MSRADGIIHHNDNSLSQRQCGSKMDSSTDNFGL